MEKVNARRLTVYKGSTKDYEPIYLLTGTMAGRAWIFYRG